MEPIGTTFVNAMKMLIGPIVFLTIVNGIASVADLKKVGLTGLKALGYFQVGTIIAMVLGLVAINVFRLGDGVNADASTIQTSEAAAEADRDRRGPEVVGVPRPHRARAASLEPFVEGNILQIIFMAVLFGIALNAAGKYGAPVLDGVQRLDRGRLQDPGLHPEGRPARRLRRDGVRRRQVRRLLPDQPRVA